MFHFGRILCHVRLLKQVRRRCMDRGCEVSGREVHSEAWGSEQMVPPCDDARPHLEVRHLT